MGRQIVYAVFNRSFQQEIIVIEESDIVAGGVIDAIVAGTAAAGVGLFDQRYFGIQASDDLQRVVGGAVINNDDLNIRIGIEL